MADHGRKFTFWVAVAFSLNYIVGSGFLAMPWAFEQTGPIIGVTVLVIFGILAMISVMFILESIERARMLVGSGFFNPHLFVRHVKGYGAVLDSSNHGKKDRLVLSVVDDPHVESGTSFEIVLDESKSPSLVNHKFELPELCEVFLGSRGKDLYTIFISIYLYGALCAYCTVFANSFASHLPTTYFGEDNFKDKSYVFYLGVFAAIVIPLSLLELSEQITLQVMLSIFRVVMLGVMLFSVGVSLYTNTPEFGAMSPTTGADLNAFHPEKLYLLLPVAAYAFIFHHAVPSIAHPVADQQFVGMIFVTALIFCLIAYVAIGVVISLYFGVNVMSSSNLCWEFFVGIHNSDGSVPMYAKLLSFFVVLFPAFDVASAYPLNAYTLGNNIMSAWYGHDMRKEEKRRWKSNLFRLIAAIPPVVGARFVRDLGSITDYTGLIAFIIMFIFPALLSRASQLKLQSVNLPTQTIHSSCFTSCFFQYLVLFTGLVLLVLVSTFLIAVDRGDKL